MAVRPTDLRPGPSGPEQAGGGPFDALFWGPPDLYDEDVHDKWKTLRGPVLGDLYPTDEQTYERTLGWARSSLMAAEDAVDPLKRRWMRYHKLYRSHVDVVPGQEWKSHVFVPICFWVIETIVPRLVAQLPRFTALPMSRDDVSNAENMELALEWASDNSKLFVELVKAFKSALKYGTGILKTYHRVDIRKGRKTQPLMATIRAPQAVPVAMDLDGYPITEVREVELGSFQAGYASQTYPYTAYDGPAAQFVDINNFLVAPEAEDVQGARYVIHRNFKDMEEILRRVQEGVYHLPPDYDITTLSRSAYDEPAKERSGALGMSYGEDPVRKVVELHEFWTKDGRIITMMNRDCIIRVQENPFDHSEKPFVRIVDHLQEGEFWGVGEIEPLEGLQDAHNALTNSRIDNLRLLLNAMFFVNYQHVEDMDDFIMRPGGIIKGRGDYKPDEVFQRIELGEPTQSAFTETQIIEDTVEKVSGVSRGQMGLDTTGGTATEMAITNEMGQSRFGMKSKLIEIEGLTDLGRQWASLAQQFISEERQIRLGLIDPETGGPAFADLTPESISGAFDIRIQSESMAQSATVRQEQRMNLLGLMAQFAGPMGVKAALEELLDALGIKDKERFMADFGPQGPMLPTQPGVAGAGGAGMGPGQAPPPAPEEQEQLGQGTEVGVPTTPPGMNPHPAEGTPGDAQAERLVDEILSGYDQAAM